MKGTIDDMNEIERKYQTSDPMWYELLKENARKNRNNPTEAEKAMWDLLKKNYKGFHFRRQHIIGDYIVDFICLSSKLVIEVDGDYHLEDNQIILDEARTKIIESLGFKVMRFSNDDVLYNPTKIKKELFNYLK